MKTITGKLEFFTELSITAAVVRDHSSKGSFDGCLAISPGDQLTVKANGEIVFQSESIQPNLEVMRKRHSAVLIPEGLTYEVWMDMLRNRLDAVLVKKGSSF